ncbi:MAG: hypothetical protein JSW20_13505 [Nitrospiraceae bacterium]|nr:MAG: hypothetical protein JSW20_13505 [Nitrospiraceae bacterium]
MKRLLYLGITVILALSFAGCGDGDSRSIFIAEILSDQPADGDIAFDPVLDSYTITNGPRTLFFGIDDGDPNLPEFRAFLDFPLDGSTGEDVLPIDAQILSASLEVFIDKVSFARTVPTLLDLVQFPVSGLTVADYDSAPLQFFDGSDATLSFNFFSSDEGFFVTIDVTSLMRVVQRLGLPDFQLRFLLDFVTDVGLVGIEDRPNVAMTAPLLRVRFR